MGVTRPDHRTRTEPAMISSHQDTPSCQWFPRLAAALDPRSAPRLVRLLRAAGLSGQYQPCYTTIAAAGKKADSIAARLLLHAVAPLAADRPRPTLALD